MYVSARLNGTFELNRSMAGGKCPLLKHADVFSRFRGTVEVAPTLCNVIVRFARRSGAGSIETDLLRLSVVAKSLIGRNAGGIHGARRRRGRKRNFDTNNDIHEPDHSWNNDQEDYSSDSDTQQIEEQVSFEKNDATNKGRKKLQRKQNSAASASAEHSGSHEESSKLKDEKNPNSKKLRRVRSGKGSKASNADQLSFTEVAPVAETILTKPEIFDSTFSLNPKKEEGSIHSSQDTACGDLKGESGDNPDESGSAVEVSDCDCPSKNSSKDAQPQEHAIYPANVEAPISNNYDVEKKQSSTESEMQLTEEKNSTQREINNSTENHDKVAGQVDQVKEQVAYIGQKVLDKVSEKLPDPLIDQVGQVAEQVSAVAEQVATTAGQVTDTVSNKLNDLLAADEDQSEDEFEAYRTSDLPEFKGKSGIKNFTVLQEDQGVSSAAYDFYVYMLKSSLPEFSLAMFAAPLFLSMLFTLLYLPEFHGLAFEETARQFFQYSEESKSAAAIGLQLSWPNLFQVFMFSVSLSTGLQPELAPLSPYTLVVANLNALLAQILFVFMSGAVFARLSQPSQPIRFSKVALVYPNKSKRRREIGSRHKVLMARYVLAGPQPCELVDVKVDLTYKYNTVTSAGTFFRATQTLKLVRTEIAYLNHGMLVRHVIDESSPLYRRTPEMLKKEDAIFVLSVVGLERSSMQPVFHVQHYCVYDGDVIWDAEFEDMILISKKNKLIMDHSKVSKWRAVQISQQSQASDGQR